MATCKEREREFKKHLIAEAAFHLFKNSSFESVTVQDIASAAECGKGTIYQFFINKDEILFYILAGNLDQLNQKIEDQCNTEANVLTALFTYLHLQYTSHNDYGPLLMSLYRRRVEEAASVDGYYAELLLKRDKKIQLVANLIKRGIHEGVIMEIDSHKMALVLNNIIRGFCLGNLENNLADTDEKADLTLIKEILVKGILTVKDVIR